MSSESPINLEFLLEVLQSVRHLQETMGFY